MPEFDEKREKRASPRRRNNGEAKAVRGRSANRGRPPGAELASLMRADLGSEASNLRIHTDEAENRKARRLGARAFTKGQDIYFDEGEYRPSTQEGRRLVAHELAHVLQQREGPTGSGPSARAAIEREADAAAERLERGEPVAVRERAAPGSLLMKEEEKKAAPSIAEHKEEILPAPPTGTISGPGFSVQYAYTIVKGAKAVTLSLAVPQGIGVTVSPLSDVAAGEIRVQGSDGVNARTVTIAVGSSAKGAPRIRVNFTKGSDGYIVVFQFPQSAEKK